MSANATSSLLWLACRESLVLISRRGSSAFMTQRLPGRLTFGVKLLLAAIGMAAIAGPLVFGVVAVPSAQSPAVPQWQTAAGGKMAFDVASVKPSPLFGDVYVPTGGLFSATNTPLMNYMRFAYKDMKLAYQRMPDLAGAPSWIRTQSYNIEAKAQGAPTKDQMRLMMQSLLADRFKLTTHIETRQMPIYALVVSREGKLGAQLKPDDGPCAATTPADIQSRNAAPLLPPPSTPGSQPPQGPCGIVLTTPASAAGRIRVAGTKIPIGLLAEMIPNPASGVDRPVIDRTGLTGTFDVSIEWTPAITPPPGSGVTFTPDPDGATFTEALQDQLGLTLESGTGPVDVLVIDHVELPSGN